MPFTAAITGFGDRTMVNIMSEQAAMVLAKKARPRSGSLRCAVSSLRSWPEENAVPAPVMTMARTASEPPISLDRRRDRAISSSDSELRASGRFSVRTATGPLVLTQQDVGVARLLCWQCLPCWCCLDD